MSLTEFEAANITSPLKNRSTNMQGYKLRCIASITVGTGSTTTDLETLFGNAKSGHFYTLQPDGSKVYVAFGDVAGTISTNAGTGDDQSWPIPDGTNLHVHLAGSRRVASGGVATMTYHTILHHMAVATCTLRIYRSSLSPTQNDASREFPAP